MLPQPLVKLLPAVIVCGTTQGPDQTKQEPGFYQLPNTGKSVLRDGAVSLQKVVTKSFECNVEVILSSTAQWYLHQLLSGILRLSDVQLRKIDT